MILNTITSLLLLLVVINGLTIIEIDKIPAKGNQEIKDGELLQKFASSSYSQAYLLMKINFIDDPTEIDVYVALSEGEQVSSTKYRCIAKECNIWIPKTYCENKIFYLHFKCKEQCTFDYNYGFSDLIYEENKFYYIEIPKENPLIPYSLKTQSEEKILLLLTGSSIDDLVLKSFKYGDKSFEVSKVFQNGFGIIIPKTDYTFQANKSFIFDLSSVDTIIRLEHRFLKDDAIQLALLEDHYTMLDYSKGYESECFILTLPQKETNEEVRYIVNARTGTNNAYLFIQNEDKTEFGKGKMIIDSDYFIFTATEIKNKKLCVRRSDSNTGNLVGLNFQIADLTDLSNSQPKMFELIRGAIINGYLPKNNVMYHRALKYSVTGYNEKALIQINMHKKKGNPVFYYYRISNFPNKIFNPKDIDITKDTMLKEVLPVNDFYSYSESSFDITPHNKPNQYAGVIYCDSTADCEYELVMSNIDYMSQSILLYENIKIARSIPLFKTNSFFFSITDSDIQQIKVYLYSFAGNCDLSNKNKEGSYSFDGNKEVITFTNTAQDGKPNSLLKRYDMIVKALTTCYYSLHYTTTKSKVEDTITETVNSNEMIVITINQREKEKTFIFNNNMAAFKINYLVTFSVLNCNVTIDYNDRKTTERYAQYTIIPEGETPQNQYSFKITLMSLDSKSTNLEENCMIYALGNEVSSNKNIVLNEGVSHVATLSKDIRSLSYLYPFLFMNDATTKLSQENIIILFDKLHDGDIKISYRFEKKGKKEVIIAKFASKKLYIPFKNIQKDCWDLMMCSLQIIIESVTPLNTEIIDFQIQIVNNYKIPIYLPKSITKYDAVTGSDSSDYQYYVSDLAKDSTGEIIVNFVKGMGKIVAKIVTKDTRDPNAEWNQRLKLPYVGEDPSIVLPYDSINNRITYTSDNTKKCEKVGCEIYIGVYSIDQNKTALKEYSITIKDTTANENIDIKPNEYLSGLLSYDLYSYYSITLKTLSKQIIIDFGNEFGEGYVNLGTMRPSKESHHWAFDGNGPMLTILASNEKIKKETLKDQVFTFALRSRIRSSVDNKYTFKVITKHIENLPAIIIGKAEETMTCDIDLETGKCHFIIPLNHYNYIEELRVCGINTEKRNYNIDLYAKIINQSVYEEMTNEEISKIIPSDTNNDYKSESHCFEALLMKKPINDTIIDNIYILITVVSKGKVSLLSTINSIPKTFKIESNEMQLFLLNRSAQKIEFEELKNTQVEIIHFQGNATIKYNYNYNKKPIYLNNDRKEVTIEINPLKPYNNIEISNVRSPYNLLFAITYSQKSEGNLTRIDYDREKIMRLERGFTFPLGYYLLIDNEDNNVLIKYDYDDLYTLPEKNPKFNLTAYIIDEDSIGQIKNNVLHELENKSIIKDKFGQSLHYGEFQVSSTEIKNFHSTKRKYIFFYAKPVKGSYVDLEPKITTIRMNPTEEPFILLPNYFQYFTISNDVPQFIQLNKTKENHDHLVIELSLFGDLYTFSCNFFKDPSTVNYTKNETDIIASFESSFGIAKITINLTNVKSEGILFTVFSNKKFRSLTSVNKLEYGIKKVSWEGEMNVLTFDSSITWSFEKNNLKIELKHLKASDNTKVAGSYTLRVYPKNPLTSDIMTSNTIAMPFETSEDYSKEYDQDEDTFIWEIPNFPTKESKYCSMIVKANRKNEDQDIEDVFVYPGFLIVGTNPDPYPDPTPGPNPDPEPGPGADNEFGENSKLESDDKNKWWVWLIIAILSVIIIIAGVMLFIYFKKRKNNKKPLAQNQKVEIQMNTSLNSIDLQKI